MSNSHEIFFRRLELKYLVDRSTRSALEQDLCAFMPPDNHCGSSDGYTVRSLYFDTPDYMAYHEKMEGTSIRHKLRIRLYGNGVTCAPFVRLEVKSRYLNIIHKTTVDVPRADYDDIDVALKNNRLPPRSFLDNDDNSREFFRIQRQYNMRPQILVQYRRRAWEKHLLTRVRANFDDELVASRNLDLFGPLRGGRSLLKYGNAIFEIKVDGSLPFWLHKLIIKYDLQNQAISKFCHAVRGQALLSTTSRPTLEGLPENPRSTVLDGKRLTRLDERKSVI